MKVHELIEKLQRLPDQNATVIIGQGQSPDVWLIVTFNDFHGFPKIGLVQPYLKPNPHFDNARFFFDCSRQDVADVVVVPLTEALRSLEAALMEVVESKATEAV